VDTPNGVHGTDFTWSWNFVSGHGYVPVKGAEPTPGPTPPPTNDGLEARVAVLETKVAQLETDIKYLAQVFPTDQHIEAICRKMLKEGLEVITKVHSGTWHSHGATTTIKLFGETIEVSTT
jgi:hypothetical protein